MNYTVNSGQNIFDVVIKTITDINNTYDFLQENNIPSIESYLLGLTVSYTPPPIVPPTVSSTKFTPPITSKTFSSIPNQSVFDIVLQTYGDLNITYKLIQESNFSSTLVYPISQTKFTFNPTLVKDAIFASYLSKKGLIINTANSQRSEKTNYLLQENGFYFDLEDGTGKILLET